MPVMESSAAAAVERGDDTGNTGRVILGKTRADGQTLWQTGGQGK